jgi:hypothetical protein
MGTTGAMANERLIRKLQQVEVARRDLAALLERLRVAIRAGIANLRRGVPASAQTPEAAKMHIELVQKLDDMHHAVHEARAEGVRVLVEDEGMPVSTVAGLMGRPRQLVSRLYQQARSGRGASVNGKRPRNGRAQDGAAAGGNGGRRARPVAPPNPGLGRPVTDAERSGGQRTRMPPAAQ